MRWTERQLAMLKEIGIRLWPNPGLLAEQDRFPLPPSSERGEGEAVALPEKAVAVGDRPVGVDAMDWPAFREAVAACTACKLCTGRRQTVFGGGNLQAHWMILVKRPDLQ